MKINNKYKYWELFYDEDNKNNGSYNESDETDRQNIASVWSDEWHGIRAVYSMSNDDLKHMLEEDLTYYNRGKFEKEIVNSTEETFNFKPISKRLIRYAIKELQKIKEELPLN